MARRIGLWSGVVILVLIGLAAAMARTVHVADASVRLELMRREVFPSTSRLVPDPDARLRDVTEFDERFGRHPLVTRLHITGPLESVVIALAGGLFLFAMGRAFLAIRTGEVGLHREWMIRMFAVAIGISSVRVVGGILDGALTPAGYSVRVILGLSLWIGWLLTVAAAEIWIRRSRYSLETRIA